ncbi:MAG: hypothetical protein N2648_05200 [Aquificaceae bacterium]|nr:hypothetical protein [Aquificaceae bacterium]
MAVLPYEIYKLLEEELGKEKAERVGNIIESSLELIERKAYEQKPLLKAEIKEELSKEMATRGDVAEVKAEVEKVRAEVEKVKAEVEKVRAEVEKVRAELKGEIGELRGELAELRAELRFVKYMLLVLTFLVVFLNKETLGWLLELIKLLL